MSFRPNDYLIAGELNINERPGYVRGWLRFQGLPEKVQLDLPGGFDSRISGSKITIRRLAALPKCEHEAAEYMEGFALLQHGKNGTTVVDVSTFMLHLAWTSEENGGIAIEIPLEEVEAICSD